MQLHDKQDMINEIRTVVSNNIDLHKDISDEEIKDSITDAVFEKARQRYLSIEEKQNIIKNIFNSMRRLGILQPLLEDSSINEIMINGPENIFIERNGRLLKLDIKFDSTETLEDVIQSIVAKTNRTVNQSTPIVDARLNDGSRVNVVLQPIALNGPIMTIRKFPEKPLKIEQMITYGSLTEECAEVLERLVRARYNIFICGGTGSGKTTFLNALSNYIPSSERIITIEDSAELQIIGADNIVSMEARNENTEGKGRVTIRDLIKTSLRMRPERIIVGEVRDQEALDMLQAMNTGHDGSLSTGHANSSADMLRRIETMVLSAAPIPIEAIRQQIASAIDIIIYLARLRDGSRKILEVTEVKSYNAGQIILNPLFVFEEDADNLDDKKNQKVMGVLKRTKNKMVHTAKCKMAGISNIDRVL